MRKLFFLIDKLERAVQDKRIPLKVFYARVYLLFLVLEFVFFGTAIGSLPLMNNLHILFFLMALALGCLCVIGLVIMRSKESYGSIKFKGPLAILNGFILFIIGLFGFAYFLWNSFFFSH